MESFFVEITKFIDNLDNKEGYNNIIELLLKKR
jgi:hypothetical protein